jgi:hypothetical protein
MASQVVFYHDEEKGIYVDYIADWPEAMGQDFLNGPCPEAFALQYVIGSGKFFAIYHQTQGLMRQVIRAAFSKFLHFRKTLTFEETKRELIPFLMNALKEGLQYPDPQITPVYDLCIVANSEDGIFQIRSDGSVIAYYGVYFSDKKLELCCHGPGTDLSVQAIRHGMSEAASYYFAGTKLCKITIYGYLDDTACKITDWRGEFWGYLKGEWDEDGINVVCSYLPF